MTKKPVLVNLPDNLGSMTPDQIAAWVKTITPDTIAAVTGDASKTDADKE